MNSSSVPLRQFDLESFLEEAPRDRRRMTGLSNHHRHHRWCYLEGSANVYHFCDNRHGFEIENAGSRNDDCVGGTEIDDVVSGSAHAVSNGKYQHPLRVLNRARVGKGVEWVRAQASEVMILVTVSRVLPEARARDDTAVVCNDQPFTNKQPRG